MLEIKNLSFGYIKAPLCIKDVSLSLGVGEKMAVFGGDGMGKTSLLKVISGLEKHYFGGIFIDGEDIKNIDNSNKSVSFLPSEPVFLNGSIRKNLDFLFKVLNVNISEEGVLKVFKLFSFDYPLNTKVRKLPLVDKRIFAMVRAYIKNSKLLLIDDQFEGVDDKNTVKIKNAFNILLSKNSVDKTVIFVDNYCDEVKFDKIFYLSYAKCKLINNIENLIDNPIDYYVTKYDKFYEKDMIIERRNGNFFVSEYKEVYDEKRKKQDFMCKNILKLGNNCKIKIENLNLNDDEFVKVIVISKTNFDGVSDTEFNKRLGKDFFIFDEGTKERLF